MAPTPSSTVRRRKLFAGAADQCSRRKGNDVVSDRTAKRVLSDEEIAEIGKVLSLCNLPRDERERKWVYLRAIRKARLVELGLKAKK